MGGGGGDEASWGREGRSELIWEIKHRPSETADLTPWYVSYFRLAGRGPGPVGRETPSVFWKKVVGVNVFAKRQNVLFPLFSK